ncbi:glycoside hydrolase family 18 protein [Cucurbitaria berberidis CBS 394.84]|uniref:chitinase n=1 Tax=Cucurbitaria berberidis CBS 394.84 TaxID=1168544 RepID=A0A9P4GID6_9PLEO|nr:glycoside hydrolase family 18 protein [Cucurbitaria berberidis CBS 394.84]KAF1846738.1 glycoside hydrolase family 18 protein [Cucurbitaria berberidis CBS 394.84]
MSRPLATCFQILNTPTSLTQAQTDTMNLLTTVYITFLAVGAALAGFDSKSKTNLAVYWGQNSAGGTGGQHQNHLSTYCADADVNIILLSFLVNMNGVDGQPELNFANQGDRCDHDTKPFKCPEIEAGIKECQKNGKTILLSLGGAFSEEKGPVDKERAKKDAEKMWQMFGPDQSKDIIRPFGSASVDGFDLDFEHEVQNMVPFGNALREQAGKHPKEHGDRQFYLSAAPVCHMPNPIGGVRDILDQLPLDMVFVQFYNNLSCDVRAGFNLEQWDGWAKAKNTTFFVGLPAKEAAAPSGGYVPPEKLSEHLRKAKGMGKMGGVMLWDASQAWSNDGYHRKIKSALNATSSSGRARLF